MFYSLQTSIESARVANARQLKVFAISLIASLVTNLPSLLGYSLYTFFKKLINNEVLINGF
jgi:hypothetical protein